MSVSFEWNQLKADANKRKHRVTFDEAATAFSDPLSITISDPAHSSTEKRFILMGTTVRQRLLVAVFSYRGDNIRIISARMATRSERQSYEG